MQHTKWQILLEILFSLAGAGYTIVIWTHLLKGWVVKRWMTVVFGICLFLDYFSTIFLCVWNATGYEMTAHNITGTLAPILMTVHYVIWLKRNSPDKESTTEFCFFSVMCWFIWAISLATGFAVMTK